MSTMQGRGLIGGRAKGPALVTSMAMNFTAAFTKPVNAIPSRRAEIRDRHHELFRKNVKDTVLVFPACIGSTFTGMVLLELMVQGHAPAAMIVRSADPLLVSGPVLADVWFGRPGPVVECDREDLFERIRTGDLVEVDGDAGTIVVAA